jgi:hypothetical protein
VPRTAPATCIGSALCPWRRAAASGLCLQGMPVTSA